VTNECPKCQTKNPPDSKFCMECATPFPGATGAVPTKTMETPIKGMTPGSIIAGKYKIVETLGRGGMGVVYKAEDIKLRRTVALKFLAPELTREKEAKDRFILEAQTASSLNHPNICTVHEIDESEGQMFIAMAFVEGESLKQRIAQGPCKIEEALDMAAQIAAGLHEAHGKGIVHRDIKSANIMITPKGQAVIMDFGIAKLEGETKITRTGTTMGTVAYMSPEQSRGEKVDHKTDIWSLGVVVYEMMIGRLPFKGDHEQAVMYSILNENPEPITALRTGVPMELERIVVKALQKNVLVRYQHTDEMLVDLKYLKENLTTFQKSPVVRKPSPSKPQPKRWKRLLPWGIAILMALLAFVFQSKLTRLSSSGGENVYRFKTEFPPELILGEGMGPRILFSPDGTNIVSYLHKGQVRQLYTLKLNEFDFHPLPGTEGAQEHFFSPDGQRVVFYSKREGTHDLFWKKADGSSETEPILIAEFDQTESSFSSDGKRLVYRENHPETGKDLWILSLEDENKREPYLVTPYNEMMPIIAPDDRYIAYVSNESGINEVYVRTFPDPGGEDGRYRKAEVKNRCGQGIGSSTTGAEMKSLLWP